MPYSLLIPLVSLLIFACSPATVQQISDQHGAHQLSGQDVLQLVNGNTLFITSHNEDSYLFFDQSGRLFGMDIYNNKDNGKWDVSDDGEVCLRMSKWWYGDIKCYTVYREADTSKLHLADVSGVLAYAASYFEGDNRSLYVAAPQKKKSLRTSVRTQEKPPEQSSPAPTAPVEPSVTDNSPASSRYATQDLRSTMVATAKNCPDCNLAGADFSKTDLSLARLSGANLSSANFRMANLRRADLRGSDLRNADLSYANLPGADLRNADLRGANLHGANLIRADLSGAKLGGADLSDALTDGATGLTR